MPVDKLHAAEIDISLPLIHQLIREQFPVWANLELHPLDCQGTDNVMIKIGEDKIIRLPRTQGAAHNIEKECTWLPRLASLLPIEIPHILGQGRPGDGYPYQWAIVNYLEGKRPSESNTLNLKQVAIDLGHFIRGLQKADTLNAPPCRRGQPLHTKDHETREALSALASDFDARLLGEMWESALEIPPWKGDPVWLHGDLHPGNLLAKNELLTGVIDFGLSGIGDPACDLMVAWTLLDQNTRDMLRAVVEPDDATWERGRGWSLHFGVVAYPYYKTKDPILAGIARRTLEEILVDRG